MKIQVVVTNMNKAAANSKTIQATVGPADTVLRVQELIANATNTFSFPDQKLLFNGQVLSQKQRLSECGVKDGAQLEFQFLASEQTLTKQISDLLGEKAITPEELSLLYSYRHGNSIEDTLQVLGYKEGQIRSFLGNQKCFSFDGTNVRVLQDIGNVAPTSATKLHAIKEDKVHGVLEVNVAVELRVPGKSPDLLERDEDENMYMHLDASHTVAKAKEIIAASEQMPFPERDLLLAGKMLDDALCLGESGVKNGSNLVLVVHASESALAGQLQGLLKDRVALSPKELGLQYCTRFGTPVNQALRTLSLPANLGRFLQGHPQFTVEGSCVKLSDGPELTTPPPREC